MTDQEQDKSSPARIAGDGLTDPTNPQQDLEARLMAEHGLTVEEARELLKDFGEDMNILGREARRIVSARRYP